MCIYSVFIQCLTESNSLSFHWLQKNKCNNIYANRNANTNTHTNRNTDRDKNTITNVLNSWASISPVDAFRPPLPHRHHLFSIPPTFLAEKYIQTHPPDANMDKNTFLWITQLCPLGGNLAVQTLFSQIRDQILFKFSVLAIWKWCSALKAAFGGRIRKLRAVFLLAQQQSICFPQRAILTEPLKLPQQLSKLFLQYFFVTTFLSQLVVSYNPNLKIHR